ncbi:MAG: hypothetical protein WA191_07080 [Telluria sp.]
MSEFAVVTSKAELAALDESEVVAGYWAGTAGASEPGSAFSRSYWHGWRNGATDFGHRQIDAAQQQLAREIVGKYRGLH